MNRTITVYELLGLIKDGKAPKKIKYENNIYEFTNYDYRCIVTEIERGFVEYWLIGNYNQNLQSLLNDKVEIINCEKHKPIIEKLNIENDSPTHFYITNEYGTKCGLTKHSKMIADKLNEVIDYINKKEG